MHTRPRRPVTHSGAHARRVSAGRHPVLPVRPRLGLGPSVDRPPACAHHPSAGKPDPPARPMNPTESPMRPCAGAPLVHGVGQGGPGSGLDEWRAAAGRRGEISIRKTLMAAGILDDPDVRAWFSCRNPSDPSRERGHRRHPPQRPHRLAAGRETVCAQERERVDPARGTRTPRAGSGWRARWPRPSMRARTCGSPLTRSAACARRPTSAPSTSSPASGRARTGRRNGRAGPGTQLDPPVRA